MTRSSRSGRRTSPGFRACRDTRARMVERDPAAHAVGGRGAGRSRHRGRRTRRTRAARRRPGRARLRAPAPGRAPTSSTTGATRAVARTVPIVSARHARSRPAGSRPATCSAARRSSLGTAALLGAYLIAGADGRSPRSERRASSLRSPTPPARFRSRITRSARSSCSSSSVRSRSAARSSSRPVASVRSR